jgi:tetratricopeptide (TPR) repeat protein
VPQAESVFVFARGIGAARSGNAAQAKQELQRLRAIHEALVAGKSSYWAEQAEIQGRVVAGWIARAEGQNDEAVALLRAAADMEDRTEKHPVTPGPIAPARELLGELLLETGRPAEALTAFSAGMAREPGRLRSLYGAALAAERSGDKARAKGYYQRIAEMTQGATEREELRSVVAWLTRN